VYPRTNDSDDGRVRERERERESTYSSDTSSAIDGIAKKKTGGDPSGGR